MQNRFLKTLLISACLLTIGKGTGFAMKMDDKDIPGGKVVYMTCMLKTIEDPNSWKGGYVTYKKEVERLRAPDPVEPSDGDLDKVFNILKTLDDHQSLLSQPVRLFAHLSATYVTHSDAVPRQIQAINVPATALASKEALKQWINSYTSSYKDGKLQVHQ
ncbi:MAG: hypothetical protein K2W94_01180 [Alphaproteobacteria bacterium]|nr:hypothetical protein [Alphaproteobacteria bacterium]